VLAILLVGKAKERNGTLCCAESYARRFGLDSKDTVQRSLRLLEERGLIVVTRRVQRLRKHPTLWAVTWWPIAYRDGQPLDYPEPATNAFLKWEPEPRLPRLSGYVTPTIGVMDDAHHPDLPPKSGIHHPDYRGQSKNLGGGRRVRTRMNGSEQHSDSGRPKVEKLMSLQPHLPDVDIAKISGAPLELVQRVRDSLR
jgi:hypothetical protein